MVHNLLRKLRTENRRLFTAALAFLVVGSVLKCLANTNADPDLWGYLAFGRLFWETGRFPYEDVFTFTPTLNPWVYHEWLTGVLYYPLYQDWGAPALQALRYTVALSTMTLVFRTARRRGAYLFTSALGLWITQPLWIIGYGPVRAQIFTYLFFTLYLFILEKTKTTKRLSALPLLVVLQVPWCNLHGGFVAGLGLLLLYTVGEALSRQTYRPYLVTFISAAAATLLNPYGFAYWTYMHHAVTMPRPQITEWAALWTLVFHGRQKLYLFYVALTLAITGCIGIRTRFQGLTNWLVLAVTAYLGIRHQRHIIFFLLAAGAYLPFFLNLYYDRWASLFRATFGGRLLVSTGSSCLLMGMAMIFVIQFVSLSPWEINTPSHPDNGKEIVYYPTGALALLKALPQNGNLLTEFDWGEYLLWNLYPQYRVALDGRFETVYPAEVCQKYWDFKYCRQHWRRFIDDYHPDLVLIYKNSQVYALVSQEPEWQEIYADDYTALFKRRDRSTSLAAVNQP